MTVTAATTAPDPARLEPVLDVAHLGHVAIFSPKPEQSLSFFTEVCGLEVWRTKGDSVYLRGWGDYDSTTLKVTAARQAGLDHVGWRCRSEPALARRADALRQCGAAIDWAEDEGHGKALRFRGPDGHAMEIYFESEKYVPPEARFRSRLLNQPMRYPARGMNAQRLDHVNLLCREVTQNRRFMESQLGFRLREHIMLENDLEAGCWISVTHQVHDIAFTRDFTGASGRLHHVAFWLEDRSDILRAADILREYDVPIEFGPNRHGITQGMFLYFFEPGGNRIELIAGGYSIYAPDFAPVVWDKQTRGTGVHWSGMLPQSFREYGTPSPVPPELITGSHYDPQPMLG